jgi:hypothetical protein
MATHAPSTTTLARRRHVRAAQGALDRRSPASAALTLIIRVPVAEHGGYPFTLEAAPVRLRWTGKIAPGQRQRIEKQVELGIALLDALDAADEDLEDGDPAEEDNEDRCEAADDDPASSQPVVPGCGSAWGLGDPADGEITPEDEGEPTDDDLPCRRLPAAALRPTTTPCSNGPFQPDSATYAALRGWRTGRPA